jgi:hypothetical protein
MRSWLLAIAICVACWASVKPTPAQAWGKNGHMIVCDMAYRNFTQTTRDKLKDFFQIDRQSAGAERRVYQSFNYACLEEDEMPRANPNDHFINFPRNQLAISGAGCPMVATSCILAGIDRELAVLRGSAPPREKARALMGIGHWVGDIHQPLHVSFADDRGGNSINAEGACGRIKLHAVWDNCIIERRIFAKIPRERSWSRFTVTYRTVDRFQAMAAAEGGQIAAWRRTQPWQWAAESFAITLNPATGYCTLKAGACWYEPDRETYRRNQPKRTVQISDAYLDRYTPVAETRLRQAGYRLAHIVNGALDPAYRT